MKIFYKDKYRELKGSRAESLIKNKAIDMANKLESVPFNITDATLNQVLKQSDFQRLRRKIAKILSLEGKAAFYVLPFRNTYMVDVLHVIEESMIGKFEQSVRGTNGSVYTVDGVDYPIYIELKYNEAGQPTMNSYVIPESDRGEAGEPISVRDEYVFNTDTLPVELFSNNEDRVSDVMYAELTKDILRLDYFDQKQRPEWERTRTLPSYNTNFTDNDPDKTTKELDAGKGYLEEDSFNAKLGAGTQMIPAGNGTAVLQNQILFLEDDIYKKLAVKRDATGTGTNKHNLEMVMSEQFGTEELIAKRDIRQEHYNQFFEKVGKVLGVTPAAITLEISPIEQAKLDLLQATVVEAKLKAQNVASQNSEEVTAEKGE